MSFIQGFRRFLASCFKVEDGDNIPQHQAFSDDMVEAELAHLSSADRAWVRAQLPRHFDEGTAALAREIIRKGRPNVGK